MRVLAVCESPPTIDAAHGNGSTLIAHHVLHRLPEDIDVDLLWFADRAAHPSDEVMARVGYAGALDVRGGRAALVAQVATRLPRATWQRTHRLARDEVARRARAADVVYLHGLHTFALASAAPGPVVVNEVDPWSRFWRARARAARWGAPRVYDLDQARRAERLERATAARAAAYVVVNAADARDLSDAFRRPVVAVPNGVTTTARTAPRPGTRDEPVIAFVGSLGYAPNVEAATRLVTRVLPAVRATVPGARVVVAGRAPVAAVLALAGPGVEVRADVDDVGDVFASAAVAVFAADQATGTKNSLLEAIAAGCPVVATRGAARGVDAGEHLVVVDDERALAAAVSRLLADDEARARAAQAAQVAAAALPTWDDAAATYADLLRRAATV